MAELCCPGGGARCRGSGNLTGVESENGPTLSVVVPVYGVESFLEECLESILSYPGPGLEVIAVNDASPDGCQAILNEYAEMDSRLTVLHLPTNVGLSEARNVGLSKASGEYVWFVDSDDWLPDGSVGVVIDRLVRTRPDVLIVDHAEVVDRDTVAAPSSDHLLRGLTSPINLRDRRELLRLAQSACTKITRRDYLDRVGLRFSPGWYEDSLYSHLLLMGAETIDGLDRVSYCYRQRPSGGITTTQSDRHFEVFAQYERLFDGVAAAGGAYEDFRPELFRIMINHYLVILGNKLRLPARSRRAFFRRVAADYARWLPEDGYPRPGGVSGLRHALVGRDQYFLYALLRRLYAVTSRWRASAARSRQRSADSVPRQRTRAVPGGREPAAADRQPTGTTGSSQAQ
ncbi:glycosyltransferase family 2 protein [Hamadaea sp. NPDC050747]|uniref:glycosyltransferase family 2 protein n=1 Tax=Hamadaea sp. NPDC050747 TaxID=3155789 RepID=UPI0034031874